MLKISETFVCFRRKPREYLTRFGQGSVFKIRFKGSVVKTDQFPQLVKYSTDVLKKTKVLDILNTDKKCFIKINVESRPQEIRIFFLKATDPHHWFI